MSRKRKRRHTNTKGYRQAKNGKVKFLIKKLARELGVPYGVYRKQRRQETDE